MTVKDEDLNKDKPTGSDEPNSEIESKPAAEFATVEEAMAEITRLKSVNSEVIDSRDKAKTKLKAIEKQSDKIQQQELEEQGKYKELLEAEQSKREELETTIRNNSIDNALNAALDEAGVASNNTAMKLINRDDIVVEDGKVQSNSVADAIATLKDEHEILFKKGDKAPVVKKAGEDEPTIGFEAEMTKAVNSGNATRKTLDNIRTKYNKM